MRAPSTWTLPIRLLPLLRGAFQSGLLACALLSPPQARAQEAARAPSLPIEAPERAAGRDDAIRLALSSDVVRTTVWHSDPVDGTRWARGADYKASFGPDGATFVPYLGSGAPRNYPVGLRLASVSVGSTPIAFEGAVAPAREGDTILFERGPLTEVYDLEPGSVEQKFRFDRLPGDGELVIRIAVESELVGSEQPDRIEFANERGAVRYGRATAIDAAGASVAAPTALTGQGIEIRVPAAFVAAARFPLVVDPLISTFTLDSAPPPPHSPDCAFDATTGRWLVVHEEVFSTSDRDVVWRLINVLDPQTINWGYVDPSLSENWIRPTCANNNATDSFLIVALQRPNGLTAGTLTWLVKARTLSASGALFGTTLAIGSTSAEFNGSGPVNGTDVPRHVEVGGDPYPTLPSNHIVVWRSTLSDASALRWRLVAAGGGGTLNGSAQLLETNTPTSVLVSPSVSKSNDGSTWNLAWYRRESTFADWSLRGARIGWSGSIVASPFVIRQYFPTDDTKVAVSTSLAGTSRWVAAYLADGGYLGTHVRTMLLDGSSPIHDADLTLLEEHGPPYPPGVPLDRDEVDVETDGNTFAVVHQARNPLTENRLIDVATLGVVGGILHLSERTLIDGGMRVRPAIASAYSGGLAWRLQLITCDKDFAWWTSGHIEGAFYDNALYTSFCHPDETFVADCPCGNPPAGPGRGCDNSAGTGGAVLGATGISSVGSDSMLLQAGGMPPAPITTFNQGNALVAGGTPFGQGVRCVGGTLLRLYVKAAQGGSAAAPGAGDASVHARSAALGDPIAAGQTRQYYVYYRDPNVLGGCPAGATYNASQSLQAVWIP